MAPNKKTNQRGILKMAVNPMQRRARTSFLLGFIVALIIMAVVVFVLLSRIKALNDAQEALEQLQVDRYVALEDLVSGQEVTMENFSLEKVRTNVLEDDIVSAEDFEYYDEGTGETVPVQKMMKINVPAGTIVTKDMLDDVDDPTTSDQRIQEYNMFLLPSHLKSGDYIDIRFQLPSGQDYIVLSKKKVLMSSQTGIWLKLSELELLTINNAIVEAWTIKGSKIYAIEYSEAGMQDSAAVTYPVSNETMQLINSNPNIVEEAKQALWARYSDNEGALPYQRNTYITPSLQTEENSKGRDSSIQSGNQQEADRIDEARAAYLESLSEE